ncbi:MAG: hypothetical protein HY872_05520 [Chloroflexi bacterium]|nr:hypothetical protein [Chloroflexota bacterium]MBI5291318.1 hypothetical protein [Chloroflexota bacterium]
MNRTKLINLLLVFALLGAVLALPTQVKAADSIDSIFLKWPVKLALHFCWTGDGCGDGFWYLSKNGTFTDSWGAAGTWRYKSGAFTLVYSSGCFPTYSGTKGAGAHLSGTMVCRNPGDGSGTWYADLVKSAYTMYGSTGISPAGR